MGRDIYGRVGIPSKIFKKYQKSRNPLGTYIIISSSSNAIIDFSIYSFISIYWLLWHQVAQQNRKRQPEVKFFSMNIHIDVSRNQQWHCYFGDIIVLGTWAWSWAHGPWAHRPREKVSWSPCTIKTTQRIQNLYSVNCSSEGLPRRGYINTAALKGIPVRGSL